jgi:cytochrome c-type biogenesis protein CcmH
VGQGESDQQVIQAVEDRYGPSILLRPPATGLTALVWVVPAVLGLIAVVALAVLFWRRSRDLDRLRREGP